MPNSNRAPLPRALHQRGFNCEGAIAAACVLLMLAMVWQGGVGINLWNQG